MFFIPLRRIIKNSSQAESRQEDSMEKIITKRKRNKNLSFCAIFNCSNCADRQKDKSNYYFPLNVNNNDKGGLNLSKVRREK